MESEGPRPLSAERERLLEMRARELKIAAAVSSGRIYGLQEEKLQMRRRRKLARWWRDEPRDLERAPSLK